jgi:hypothetical protein
MELVLFRVVMALLELMITNNSQQKIIIEVCIKEWTEFQCH